MIRATQHDVHTPRYGINRQAWQQIVRLAMAYQSSSGGYDWPGHAAPDPRERNARLCFARWLHQTGCIHEHV